MNYLCYQTILGRDSSVGMATSYGLDLSGDRIPLEASLSAPVQTAPRAHSAPCTMGTGSFPGVKRRGRGIDHPPPSSAEIKEWVELYLYSPSGPSWPVLEQTLTLPLPLPNNTASETFLNKLGGVGSVDWIFLTGAPAWRWMANTTLDKTF